MPPEKVGGRYRLVERIARGGMAEVWEAEDTVLSRSVAVKVLLPHLAADEAFLARFRREAVAAARLSHPHIVGIYDTCAGEGCEAIVMELVRGPTLRELLDAGTVVSVERAVDIVAQVADALHHAHLNGLVHRDVKPGNILLADDGRVLVADFGIAKAAEAASDLTEVGQVVGTAKYLSPEQVRGEPLDARSDVYSLGVVLYELLCGRPPFDAGDATSTALARLTTEPLRPRQVRAGIPRGVEDVVLRAMQPAPADRYASAAELRAALLALDLGSGADPTGELDPGGAAGSDAATSFARSERSWMVPAALIIVVAATLGTIGLVIGRSDVGRELLDTVTGARRGSGPVTVTAIESFDPAGDGRERDGDLALAVDGDPATAWRTETYRAPLGRLGKAGVGIVVRTDPARLDELTVVSGTPGWEAEVFTAEAPAGDLAGWGEPVASVAADGGELGVRLPGRRAGAVLVWFTRLADVGDGRWRVEIGEVRLAGRPPS